MQAKVTPEKVEFDYKIRSGVSSQFIALHLLKLRGFPIIEINHDKSDSEKVKKPVKKNKGVKNTSNTQQQSSKT